MATRLGLRAALAVLALVFASPAHASGTQESILQDDAQLIYASPQHMAQTLEQLSSLGVDRVKVSRHLVAGGAKSDVHPPAEFRRQRSRGVSGRCVGPLRHVGPDGAGARAQGVLRVLAGGSRLGVAARRVHQARTATRSRPGPEAVPAVRRSGRTALQRRLRRPGAGRPAVTGRPRDPRRIELELRPARRDPARRLLGDLERAERALVAEPLVAAVPRSQARDHPGGAVPQSVRRGLERPRGHRPHVEPRHDPRRRDGQRRES